MEVIGARKLSKEFSMGAHFIRVLDNVSLTIERGEFVVIEGDSGSGKTTLLNLLSGLERPSAGRVRVAGRDITDASESQLAGLRNETMGFVFQAFHLVPSLTALENVMLPAELHADGQARQKAVALLNQVGLEHRAANFPQQLSGGEMQRVALCRALINRPAVIFADEPTGNLDSQNGHKVLELLVAMQRQNQTTLLMATHNREVSRQADRIVRLRDGRING